MKKNIISLQFFLSAIILIMITILEIWYAYDIYNVYKKHNQDYLTIIDKCKKSETELTTCSSLISKGKPIMPDTITLFFTVLIGTNLVKLQILSPVVIIIISSYLFYYTCKTKDKESDKDNDKAKVKESHHEKTNSYQNQSIKIKDNDYIKKAYLTSLKSIWIFPSFLLILFFVCFIISGHFNINKTLSYYSEQSIPISINYIKNSIPFILLYMFNVIMNSCFYVNLSLMTIKKSSNFIISTLSSYTLFLFSSIFSEKIIGELLLEKILKITNASNILNMFNYWTYNGLTTSVSLAIFTIYNIILVIVSFTILYKTYKNKEKTILKVNN